MPPAPKARPSFSTISSDGEGIASFREELLNSPAKGEIKQQKACVQCRRSKVKCIHEGGPPCRRCVDTKQECKFRLRADDENWRERTDETLSKLSQAVDTLLSGTQQMPHAPQPRPTMPIRMASAPGLYTNHPPASPGSKLSGSHFSLPSRSTLNGIPLMTSPHSEPGGEFHSPSNEGGSSTEATSPGFDRKLIPRKRDAPANDNEASVTYHASPRTPPSYQRLRRNSSTLMPPPLPPTHLDQEQVLPSPVLSHLLSSSTSIYIPGRVQGPRWMMGTTTSYGKATMTIGRDDPRMNAISIGLISMDRARSLFMFFAETMQPHSFGFPTYPAAEQMTPIIISAILMVASLHEPYSRHLYSSLRNDCLSHIRPDQEIHAELSLDPELGIGVEEITGACVASSWLGGELGWRIARIARWWTVGYLKHFELPDRSLTVGECLTILPPFRQIDLVDKLRIWLAAYVAEAQQAFILDRPSFVPDCSPMPYVDALRNAFHDNTPSQMSPSGGSNGSAIDTRGSMTGGSGGAMKYPPPPDRQLVGHASILSILLNAQSVQREARWVSASDDGRVPYGNDNDYNPVLVHECVERLIGCWFSWQDETDRWKADASALEDLSSSTTSAMDLTLTYHLAKAHLGSLALEPEYHSRPAVAHAASRDPRLQQVQLQVINSAKSHALAALQLAVSPIAFRDRLVYLPGFYHFLLTHAAGFLLLLVQRKGRFMMAGEAKTVFETVEQFSQAFVYDISVHNFHPFSRDSVHPSLAMVEALARANQHLRLQTR